MLLNRSVELRGKSRSKSSERESLSKITASRKRPRLRSRNTVIDNWLAGEHDGSDAYADLEDFLVDE